MKKVPTQLNISAFFHLLLLFINLQGFTQDIGVVNISSPANGCQLSANENVTIQVFNFGTSISGSFDVTYTINGSPVTETISLGSPFIPNSTYTYTFTAKADLSTPGNYFFTAYTALASDINNSNDTLKNFLVRSDAFSNGGDINPDTKVCAGSNIGMITLSNYVGNILRWEFSENLGPWNNISNTTNTHAYSNLSQNTQYRALIQNGLCPSVYSPVITVSVDNPSSGGNISGSDTVCISSNTGNMNITGHNGDILDWESSINNGSNWISLSHTNDNYTFNNLVQNTWFRVKIKNGVCGEAFSDTAMIYVLPESVGGIINGGTSVCSGMNNGTLNVSGHTGSVVRWQFSENGGTNWTDVPNFTDSYNYNNLTVNTLFRAEILSCQPSSYSATAQILVDAPTVEGILTGDTTVCETSNTGVISLTGYTGGIDHWEQSVDNGQNWQNITNQAPVFNFNNLQQTTMYRVLVQNGSCPALYSNIVTVTVNPESKGGNINSSHSACILNNSGSITLNNFDGDILHWEYSEDFGTNWNSIVNNTNVQMYSVLNLTTFYRAIVKNGVCPSVYSDTAIITITDPSVAGVLTPDTTMCRNSNAELSLTGHTADSFSWIYSTDNGISWDNYSTGTNAEITVSGIDSETLFQVIVSNGACPADTSNTVQINIFEKTINAGNDITITEGENTALNGSGGSNYSWFPSTGLSNPSIANPLASPTQTTEYILTVTDDNGCTDSDTITITVIPSEAKLIISNLVTPNGDGYNDFWEMQNLHKFNQVKATVMNGKGQVIFQADHYTNNWDARYNGNVLADGTYYYIVIADEEIYKGFISIISN
jgi:gliding motility-associated-like protein